MATSTAKAEYRATVTCIDEVCSIRRIGHELNCIYLNKPTILYIDNKLAIHMIQNANEGKLNKGKKHIKITRIFIQQHIIITVDLIHVKSSLQLPDILTKPLSKTSFEEQRRKIMKEEY